MNVGLKPNEFYDLTLYEFRCIEANWIINNAKAWEHTRLISYTTFAVNSTKSISIQEYLPLLTDPVHIPKVVTKEDKQKLYEQAQERLKMIPK